MKKMKSYPAIIADVQTLDRVYKRLLNDTSVVFVQSQHCCDVMGTSVWHCCTDWSHLKGGAAIGHPATGDIFKDVEEGYKPFYLFNIKIFTLEWMRPDRVLHVIEVRLPDRPLFTDCLGLGQ